MDGSKKLPVWFIPAVICVVVITILVVLYFTNTACGIGSWAGFSCPVSGAPAPGAPAPGAPAPGAPAPGAPAPGAPSPSLGGPHVAVTFPYSITSGEYRIEPFIATGTNPETHALFRINVPNDGSLGIPRWPLMPSNWATATRISFPGVTNKFKINSRGTNTFRGYFIDASGVKLTTGIPYTSATTITTFTLEA